MSEIRNVHLKFEQYQQKRIQMKRIPLTIRSLGLPAFVLALLTLIALAVGFGISITNLQGSLSSTRNDLSLARLKSREQESVLAELILNSTNPPPARNVIQSGTYRFIVDNGEVDQVQFTDQQYRLVEIISPVRTFIILEVDMPSTSVTLEPIGLELYRVTFINFVPAPLLPYFEFQTSLFLNQQNRNRFAVTGNCLSTGDCILAGQHIENFESFFIPNIITINYSSLYLVLYVIGPPSVLEGQTFSFSGTLTFVIDF